MHTRPLGSTDVRLTEIALGTWGLASGAYGRVEPEQFEKVVKEAFDRGIRTFDVAPLWGNGESERRVAVALGPERRKEATFVGRVGFHVEKNTVLGKFDSHSILDEVDRSLARLARDHIDVLLLHCPPLKVLQSDLFQRAIEELVAAGKVRAWGIAVGSSDEALLAIKIGAQAVGIVYHLLAPHHLDVLTPMLKERSCGVIVRSPLCHGLLAGRWTKETRFPNDDHRSRRWDTRAFAKRIAQVEELRFLVHDGIPDLATAALRFALASPLVTTVAVGARTPEQAAHAAAASVEPPYLPEADRIRVTKLVAASV
jgi:aryl-alcohol dehydrogenase-like predicted oxidoreductase